VTTLPHDRSDLLWKGGESAGPSALFADSIDRWVDAMVADEHGGGGGTDEMLHASVVSKQSGVIAGMYGVDRLVERHFADCTLNWMFAEGQTVEVGDRILRLEGPAEQVLRCERILLNLLGRLSGIATCTAGWVDSAGGLGIACTRKTEWGLLDKWAVHVGGGLTHRLDRSDALMIKENDLAVLAPDAADETAAVAAAVSGIEMPSNAIFTVVEVRDEFQAIAAAGAWAEMQVARSGTDRIVLLLDNMGVNGCAEAHEALIAEGLRAWCILEGSGGVVRAELDDWVASGVDLISTSALNRGVAPLDLSMRIIGGD
jgi:nicotinate-nucleotide pyrophosphorylase (carboxylating)